MLTWTHPSSVSIPERLVHRNLSTSGRYRDVSHTVGLLVGKYVLTTTGFLIIRCTTRRNVVRLATSSYSHRRYHKLFFCDWFRFGEWKMRKLSRSYLEAITCSYVIIVLTGSIILKWISKNQGAKMWMSKELLLCTPRIRNCSSMNSTLCLVIHFSHSYRILCCIEFTQLGVTPE